MRIIKVLHTLSYLKWVFMVWMVGLILYIFIYRPEDSIQKTGTALLLGGILMGFTSLSDITRISEKEKKALSNPKFIKRQLISLFASVIVLVLISALFLFIRFIIPTGDKSILNDIAKLGYDCLVGVLGFLCLIKQFADQVNYVKGMNGNETDCNREKTKRREKVYE